MKKLKESKIELKDSYFNGFEYKGYHVRTNLVIEGQNEYKPLQFSNSAEVYNSFKKLRESDKERFYSILLDTKNKVIGVDMVSQGSVDSSPVHPRVLQIGFALFSLFGYFRSLASFRRPRALGFGQRDY